MNSKTPIFAFVISYSNSDFTNPHEVVLPDEPKDCRSDFTHMGVKYTGLETCRHCNTSANESGHFFDFDHDRHNWMKIAFRERTKIDEIRISTKFFTGNQVRAVSVILEDELTGEKSVVLERAELKPDSDHSFQIQPTAATECEVKLFYEGGISRIHFFGGKEQIQLPRKENLLEKAAISHVSNDHYGHPKTAVFGNRKETHMVGWESARTGFGEQALFHFQKPTKIWEIVVDTYLHRLNAPLSCHVFGVNPGSGEDLESILTLKPKWSVEFSDGQKVIPENFRDYMLNHHYLNEKTDHPKQFRIHLFQPENSPWKPILPFEKLRPDTFHRFSNFENSGVFTHLLYMHYPNGGVHGLKVFGEEV